MTVVVYGRPDRVCMKCSATKRWLKRHGILFEFVNIDNDADAHNRVALWGAMEVPVVAVNDGGSERWWSGHRIPELEKLAQRLAAV